MTVSSESFKLIVMRAWLLSLALPLAAAACTPLEDSSDASVANSEAAADGGEAGRPSKPTDDRDRDGVCDATERELGSDFEQADSDRDGLPDLTEIIARFNPTDPKLPGPDQVGFLTGASQAELDFELRLTVEGGGQGYTGEFGAGQTTDPEGLTAKDFFEGAVALGADPRDNVRGLQAASERFTSVLGKTRLTFQLQFRYGAEHPANCTLGYPFFYRLKTDTGHFEATRNFLLVVAPGSSNGGRPEFCQPPTCL